MDLYIQVGVILLFLAALSLFVYFYTQPAQQFTEGINSTTKELNQRLETASGVNLNQYLLNSNVSGAQLKKLITDAEANEIAILVQTKAQKGLVVNYGYQMRSSNVKVPDMSPNGRSGAVATDWEKMFVFPFGAIIDSTFNNYYVNPAKIDFKLGYGSMTSGFAGSGCISCTYSYYDKPLTVETTFNPHLNNYYPSLVLANSGASSQKNASDNGEVTMSTGLMYSRSTLRTDFEPNLRIDANDKSVYNITDTMQFYTTLIKSEDNKIIGVLAEEKYDYPLAAFLPYLFKNYFN